MAKTIEEIIEVEALFDRKNIDNHNVEVYEIFCGFNQPKEKVVFSGLVKDIPDYIRSLRYTTACYNEETKTHIVKYTNHESFEGKKLFQQLQIQTQEPLS